MDKKALVAIALSLGIWVAWQKLYLEPFQKQAAADYERQQLLLEKSQAKEKLAEIDAKGVLPDTEKKRGAEGNQSARSVTLQNADSVAEISNEPALLRAWQLKTFSTALEKQDDKISLQGVTGYGSQARLRFSDAQYEAASLRNWDSLDLSADGRSASSRISTPSLVATRRITLDAEGFGGTVDYEVQFLKEPPKYVFLDLYGSPKREHDHEGSIFGQAPDKVHVTFRDLTGRHSQMAANQKEAKESAAGVRWLGLDTRYFVFAVVPNGTSKDNAGAQVAHDETRFPAVRGSLVFPVDGKKTLNFGTKIYFGPKHMEHLSSVDPILTDAIDFGWTSFLAIPLLRSLKWLYGYVHNYGLAIMILTFLIKVLLFPLTYKSTKSMAKIAVLQPQLAHLGLVKTIKKSST